MRLSRSARTHADIDHSGAAHVQRTSRSRLPTLRDAGTDDDGDPRRLHLAAAIELRHRTLAEPEKLDPPSGPRRTADYLMPGYGSRAGATATDRDAIPDTLAAQAVEQYAAHRTVVPRPG